jgi:hypothetical protein
VPQSGWSPGNTSHSNGQTNPGNPAILDKLRQVRTFSLPPYKNSLPHPVFSPIPLFILCLCIYIIIACKLRSLDLPVFDIHLLRTFHSRPRFGCLNLKPTHLYHYSNPYKITLLPTQKSYCTLIVLDLSLEANVHACPSHLQLRFLLWRP